MSFLDSLVSTGQTVLGGLGTVVDSFGGLGGIGQTFKIKELGWVPGATTTPGIAGGPGAGGGAAGGAGLVGMTGPASPAQSVMRAAGGVMASPFGGRFIDIAGQKLLDRWDRAQSLPVQGADIITIGQADDKEVAKLAVKHAVIPADSDYGQMLQAGGAKVSMRRVKMSDGSTINMRVIATQGSRKRRRRNYNTAAGRRNAARTLRQMGQEVRTFKRLAKMGAQIDRQLNPKRSTPCVAKRTTTCRKR